ncbi:MAG: hypothetical protein Q9204_008961, partial [Flavoplaca sp. TL-2023a]
MARDRDQQRPPLDSAFENAFANPQAWAQPPPTAYNYGQTYGYGAPQAPAFGVPYGYQQHPPPGIPQGYYYATSAPFVPQQVPARAPMPTPGRAHTLTPSPPPSPPAN